MGSCLVEMQLILHILCNLAERTWHQQGRPKYNEDSRATCVVLPNYINLSLKYLFHYMDTASLQQIMVVLQ